MAVVVVRQQGQGTPEIGVAQSERRSEQGVRYRYTPPPPLAASLRLSISMPCRTARIASAYSAARASSRSHTSFLQLRGCAPGGARERQRVGSARCQGARQALTGA